MREGSSPSYLKALLFIEAVTAITQDTIMCHGFNSHMAHRAISSIGRAIINKPLSFIKSK